MKIGDRVCFGVDGRYGRIVRMRPYWRTQTKQEETLYDVRYYDPKTGKLMRCPDERCKGENEHCPICGRNLWADELRPINSTDLKFYKAEGLITDED